MLTLWSDRLFYFSFREGPGAATALLRTGEFLGQTQLLMMSLMMSYGCRKDQQSLFYSNSLRSEACYL